MWPWYDPHCWNVNTIRMTGTNQRSTEKLTANIATRAEWLESTHGHAALWHPAFPNTDIPPINNWTESSHIASKKRAARTHKVTVRDFTFLQSSNKPYYLLSIRVCNRNELGVCGLLLCAHACVCMSLPVWVCVCVCVCVRAWGVKGQSKHPPLPGRKNRNRTRQRVIAQRFAVDSHSAERDLNCSLRCNMKPRGTGFTT